jgi:hypothetical protein
MVTGSGRAAPPPFFFGFFLALAAHYGRCGAGNKRRLVRIVMICQNVTLPNQSFDILTHISADLTGVEKVLLSA